MANPNEYGYTSKYAMYRKIKADRVYRTLGKMNWVRVVLGLVLLISVFFISGSVSEFFAAREKFTVAETCMVAPGWMEKYKPETKALIEAGVIYQQGDYETALDDFSAIEDFDAAVTMANASRVHLAEERFLNGDVDAAYELLTEADPDNMPDEAVQLLKQLCADLSATLENSGENEKAETIRSIADSEE